jgi:hypothetical protein
MAAQVEMHTMGHVDPPLLSCRAEQLSTSKEEEEEEERLFSELSLTSSQDSGLVIGETPEPQTQCLGSWRIVAVRPQPSCCEGAFTREDGVSLFTTLAESFMAESQSQTQQMLLMMQQQNIDREEEKVERLEQQRIQNETNRVQNETNREQQRIQHETNARMETRFEKCCKLSLTCGRTTRRPRPCQPNQKNPLNTMPRRKRKRKRKINNKSRNQLLWTKARKNARTNKNNNTRTTAKN